LIQAGESLLLRQSIVSRPAKAGRSVPQSCKHPVRRRAGGTLRYC
jgi:hypothetical protein